jgi:hypothetical protein
MSAKVRPMNFQSVIKKHKIPKIGTHWKRDFEYWEALTWVWGDEKGFLEKVGEFGRVGKFGGSGWWSFVGLCWTVGAFVGWEGSEEYFQTRQHD